MVPVPVLKGKCPEQFCSRARAENGEVILSGTEGLVFRKVGYDAVPVVAHLVESVCVPGGVEPV